MGSVSKRMKKIVLGILLVFFLSGCSLLEGVNDSIDYTKEATEHIKNLSDFAEEAPQLIQNAANDSSVKEELKNKLTDLKQEIETFNLIEAPTIAKDIHQNLVEKNEKVLSEINRMLENGQLAIEKIENSEIIQTLNEVSQLLNQIENLGL